MKRSVFIRSGWITILLFIFSYLLNHSFCVDWTFCERSGLDWGKLMLEGSGGISLRKDVFISKT